MQYSTTLSLVSSIIGGTFSLFSLLESSGLRNSTFFLLAKMTIDCSQNANIVSANSYPNSHTLSM